MTGLQRTLGLTALIFYGVGTIIGAGIYSVIGAAAGRAGEGLWQAFLLAAGVAALSALSYAELIGAIPRVGGEYVFLRRAFPERRWLSFCGGILVVVAGAATAATVAISFGGYLSLFVATPQWLAAAGLLVACLAVNVAGIRQSTWVNILLTSIEALGLVLVIGAGVSAGNILAPLSAAPTAGILTATAIVFFVYTGFESVVNLAEEARNPARDVPRALLIGLGITAVFYTLVALAVVTLAEVEELAASDSPLSLAAGKAAGWLSTALAWIALCATANTALVTFISISRFILGMARDGVLHRAAAAVLPGRRTPWVAAVAIFVGALAMVPLGGVDTVASISSLATLVAFIGVNAALIALRRREPELERPFRVPWAVRGVPVPTVLAIAGAVALGTRFTPTAYAVTGIALAAAAVLYLVTVRGRTPPNEPSRRDEAAQDPAGSSPGSAKASSNS